MSDCLQWLDAAREKGGEIHPDAQKPKGDCIPHPEERHRGQKNRSGAPTRRCARRLACSQTSQASRDHHQIRAFRRSALSLMRDFVLGENLGSTIRGVETMSRA
jgi:hypothetical protein